MLERLMSLSLLGAAGAAVMLFGTPAAAPPVTPAKAPVTVGPPPDLTLGLVKAEPLVLTAAVARCACSGPVDCTCANCKCKTGNECKRSTPLKPVAATTSSLNMGNSHVLVDAPLYTQPQPAAKPKAAPTTYRYYYVPQRQQSSCANGQCGTRRGFFGRRR